MATKTPTGFASVVQAKLLENKLAGRKPDSIRSLAREMGRGSDARTETYRRSLFKWMADGDPKPSTESRALVALALGNCEAHELADDDAEDDPVAVLIAQAIRAAVRAELKSNDPAARIAASTAGSSTNGG